MVYTEKKKKKLKLTLVDPECHRSTHEISSSIFFIFFYIKLLKNFLYNYMKCFFLTVNCIEDAA